jgi:hypothetical protein
MLQLKFATIGAALVLTATFIACKDTTPSGCAGGTCGGGNGSGAHGDGGEAGSSASSTSSTLTTCPLSDGGTEPPADVSSCVPPSPSTVSGNYPCDMQTLVQTVCMNCHDQNNLQPGVPFALNTYADSQQVCSNDICTNESWIPKLMSVAWTAPNSHNQAITCDQFITLTSWLDSCAPAAPAGQTCP